MKVNEVIRKSLEDAHGIATALFTDMRDQPFTTYKGANTPYWLLGHVTCAEASLLDQYLSGRPNRYAAWAPMFGPGSTPQNAQNGGPAYDELLDAYKTVHADVLNYVDHLDPASLTNPCHKPDTPGPAFETISDCLSALSLHTSLHAGQMMDARRAAGKPRMFL
ncbi:MAG: DinB family protein [Planctomycetota bacterium]|nr:DinB family protein [Planctomycetota bacterium]